MQQHIDSYDFAGKKAIVRVDFNVPLNENFEITDADIDEEIKKMAEQYKMKFEDLNKNIRDSDRESIREDLKIQKAVDFVMDNAKERAKAKKKAAADKEESDKED